MKLLKNCFTCKFSELRNYDLVSCSELGYTDLDPDAAVYVADCPWEPADWVKVEET